MNINFNQILNLLSLAPASGVPNVVLFSILLYAIFVLAVLCLFLMPDKNMLPTLLVAAVLLASVIGKLITGGANLSGFRPAQFGSLIINVIPFLAPFLVAGMTRTRKRSNPVVPLSILMGIFGGIYFFLFWFFLQRGL
jgi:hypothetical protein